MCMTGRIHSSVVHPGGQVHAAQRLMTRGHAASVSFPSSTPSTKTLLTPCGWPCKHASGCLVEFRHVQYAAVDISDDDQESGVLELLTPPLT